MFYVVVSLIGLSVLFVFCLIFLLILISRTEKEKKEREVAIHNLEVSIDGAHSKIKDIDIEAERWRDRSSERILDALARIQGLEKATSEDENDLDVLLGAVYGLPATTEDEEKIPGLVEMVEGLSKAIQSFTGTTNEMIGILTEAVKAVRHKAGIYTLAEKVAEEYGISEEEAQAMIDAIEDESKFYEVAKVAKVKLADIAKIQVRINEILAATEEQVIKKEEK